MIPNTKIAVEDISRFSESDIDNRIEFGWFQRDGDGKMEALRLALIDAMEIRITREDPEAEVDPIMFTWDIVSY